MNNRMIYGLHILPDDRISESQYQYIRAFVERACSSVQNNIQNYIAKESEFSLLYNIGIDSYLSVYKHPQSDVMAGIYTIRRENNSNIGDVSQICDAYMLRMILLRDVNHFADRCINFLKNMSDLEYVMPEELLSAWRQKLPAQILASQGDKEQNRWKTFPDKEPDTDAER